MTVRQVPELREVDGVPSPPDECIEGEWEKWHDDYVRALSKIDGVDYLTFDIEVPDSAVLIDRRGVVYTKSWDGQDIYDRDDPECWTWNARVLRLDGWDPDRCLVLGPQLGIDDWRELPNEDTMPLRIVSDDAVDPRDFNTKCIAQDESCGPGGVRRGNTVIADSVGEMLAFIKKNWSGKSE